jgi:hypothetical protein
MTQLDEAAVRYHKILDSDPLRNEEWMQYLRSEMAARRLTVNHRPVSPVLRPHFISRRQYSNLARTAESLYLSMERVRKLAFENPQLMSRMELRPAEKMLASVDPGYNVPAVTALLETRVNNGSLHFTEVWADLPYGVAYGEALTEVFYDAPPVKELRKKFKLSRTSATKPLVSAILRAWKDFGGRTQPTIAVVEFRQPFQTPESHEYSLLVEIFRKHGLQSQLVSPEELEYRGGELRAGGLRIDVVYRGVRAHEFLLRHDLRHPLVQAYRDRTVCVVNSFRAEFTRKRALFALLTDESVTGSFPAEERKAIAESIPWTRLVARTHTTRQGETIQLPEYILKHRHDLVLRPNEATRELPSYEGAAMDQHSWERALNLALRNSYVVQQRVETHPIRFPVDVYGRLEYRDLIVEVSPCAFLGKVQGALAKVEAAQGSYSTVSGFAPTFIVESK